MHGAVITVQQDGQPIARETDGYIGQLKPGANLVLKIEAADGLLIVAFTVDGKKNIIRKKRRGSGVFELTVPVHPGEAGGKPYTNYPFNNPRLLRYWADGSYVAWEVAIVSQKGRFFQTTQQTYNGQCYRIGRRIIAPAFEKWPQMEDLLKELLAQSVTQLPDLATHSQEDSGPNEPLESMQGRVVWYNLAQGVGAIETIVGAARVHWSNITPLGRLAYLTPGDTVLYKRLEEPKNTGHRTSSFNNEAVGVQVITA